jgi:lipoyl(octanoyl) transferase
MNPQLDLIRWGLPHRLTPYELAWERQRALHAQRVAGLIPDTCLLLEHPPVFTAGRRSRPEDRPTDGTPVVEVDRGGEVTWHGPGQLVGYPIVALPVPIKLVRHVHRQEEALIRTCADLGVATTRIDGRSGVWVLGSGAPEPMLSPSCAHRQGLDRKIAAVGVRVSRWTTMHGFALNCDSDLTWFDRIGPCGIRDAGVTSLSQELGRPVRVAEVLPRLEHHLRAVLQVGSAEEPTHFRSVPSQSIRSATTPAPAPA